jgi:hypothetical protein
MDLGGSLEYQFAAVSSREMMSLEYQFAASSPPTKAMVASYHIRNLPGFVLPWDLGGNAARYCGGQGANCRWSINGLFWVSGGILWRRQVVHFVHWWLRVLGVWYLDMWRRRGRLVGVVLVVQLFERRVLPLFLLAKDLDGVLDLCKSCYFSINVLLSSFGMLSCC